MQTTSADLTALHNQYTATLSRNKATKARYNDLLSQIQQQHRASTSTARTTNPTLKARPESRNERLTAHLHELRLQRTYTDLQILADHTARINELIEHDLRDVEPQVLDESGFGVETDVEHARRRVVDLLGMTRALTERLEGAVVQGRLELRRERGLFEDAQKRVGVRQDGEEKGEDDYDDDMVVRVRGLEGVRIELQGWIEGSLARCEEGPGRPALDSGLGNFEGGDAGKNGDELEESVTEADVKRQYEEYVEARRNLLQVMNVLKAPLLPLNIITPPTNTTTRPEQTQPQTQTQVQTPTPRPAIDRARTMPLQQSPTQRPTLPRHHHSRISSSQTHRHTPNPSTSSPPTLSVVEAIHIPTHAHQKLLSTYLAHLQAQTHAQDVQLLQTLSLLSHESHLLPSHPIQTADIGKQISDVEMTEEQREVEALLRAWAFAATQAESRLEGSVDGMVREARVGLERAGREIEGLEVLEGMGREIFGGS